MSQPKLLPCPFCGGQPRIDELKLENCPTTYRIECWCSMSPETDRCENLDVIAGDWNTRDYGWQPIETAPKDNTEVDLWSPKYGRLTNYFRDDRGNQNVVYLPIDSGPSVVRDATHWMPIPTDPNEGGGR